VSEEGRQRQIVAGRDDSEASLWPCLNHEPLLRLRILPLSTHTPPTLFIFFFLIPPGS